jgi:hypothetical protein
MDNIFLNQKRCSCRFFFLCFSLVRTEFQSLQKETREEEEETQRTYTEEETRRETIIDFLSEYSSKRSSFQKKWLIKYWTRTSWIMYLSVLELNVKNINKIELQIRKMSTKKMIFASRLSLLLYFFFSLCHMLCTFHRLILIHSWWLQGLSEHVVLIHFF